ncbi:unnamed protein product, partial [Callosobruchus maculatus]
MVYLSDLQCSVTPPSGSYVIFAVLEFCCSRGIKSRGPGKYDPPAEKDQGPPSNSKVEHPPIMDSDE